MAKGEVSKLVDEHDLGSCAARRGSSSLPFPTKFEEIKNFPDQARVGAVGVAFPGTYGAARPATGISPCPHDGPALRLREQFGR